MDTTTNTIVQQFCSIVQQQASGQQVDFAAEEVDVTIVTSGSANECTILDTVRVYDTGGHVLGDDFFTIQLLFQQVVYTVSEVFLTEDFVTSLVENGYNRGRGGRVRFRTLLQETDAFEHVLDVEVLDELDPPSPTTDPPSVSPSELPTESPSSFPTQVPTETPSHMPSMTPSVTPSAIPTRAPSTIPTVTPSNSPSFVGMADTIPTLSNDEKYSGSEPSAEPSSVGASVLAADETPSYVIAAIAIGSWAILMACFFSLFLCRKAKKENDQEQLLTNGRPNNEDSTPPLRDTNRTSLEQSQDSSALPIVPDVVLADDDHRSLANTTLGEETAGRKPPRKKRLVDTSLSISSFEDESLYTSPIGIIPRIEPGRHIDEDEEDTKEESDNRIHSPPTLGVSSAFGSDIFFSSETGSSSQESWTMPPISPVASKIGDLVASDLGPVPDGNPEALPSEQGSQYTESRDDMDGMSEPATWPTQQLPPRSSPSSLHSSLHSLHSLDTMKAQNFAAANAVTTAPKRGDDDHPTIDAPGKYERSGSSSLLVTRKKLDDDKVVSEKAQLRSPLQVLETHKEESPTPVGHERSPIQILEDEDIKTDVSPIDLQDSVSSTTELSKPLSNDRPPRVKTHPWQTGKVVSTPTDSAPKDSTARRSVSPYRTRYLQGLQSPTAQRELEQTSSFGSQLTPPRLAPNTRPEPPMTGKFIAPRIVTPPSDLLPANYSTKQGENLRNNILEYPPPVSLAEGDMSVLTTSSSETSNGDDPWLFGNVEQFLGPRSASADMESLGGKSTKSNKSGRSWRSHRSAKSLGARRGRKRRNGSSVASRGSQRSNFSFGSPGDSRYKHASDFSLAPRSLENDLRRLEQQLASLKSIDPEKQQHRVPPSPPGLAGSSNSVSASSVPSSSKASSKQKIIVIAPPGKLGVVLANRHNGTGTVVSELRGSSALRGALFPGDKLLAIDETDVTGLNVSQITAIMLNRSDQERRLTVTTSSKVRSRASKVAAHGSTTASKSENSP